MSLLFLFSCAIFTIQLSNGALSWYLENCELFYNRADSNAVGAIEPVLTSCTDVPDKMPCDCSTNPFFVKLYNEPADPSNTFELTGNSYIEGVVTINRPSPDDFYQLSAFTFAWEVANQPVYADPTLSYVQVLDANENIWEDVATLHNWNGVLLTAQNLTWMDCNPSSLSQWTTYRVRFRLEWNASATSIYPAYIEITGLPATKKPTTAPTELPSVSPTKNPTVNPTKNPTRSPTSAPTTPPTAAPSAAPTFTIVQKRTKQYPGVDFFNYSDNLIPLSSRGNGNMTYNNYHLPDEVKPNGEIKPGDERPYCITCILAWADIDASIELKGCPNTTYNYSSTNPNDPNSIYHCHNGTWILRTSGRLADWQDTYGRIEIWEVDDNDIKWLQFSLEFNWWNRSCFIIDDDPETLEVETIDCPVLPLTGTQEQAAYFEFTIPKKYGDSRTAPLVVVWYDILSIPYSLKPELDYEYLNFTLYVPTQGVSFGLDDAMQTFRPALVAAGILFACFLAVMLLSCFVSGDKKRKSDFMIDTRNLKTTFRHTPETIIVPPSEIENRARFSCARHGPWLLVVLVARLIYMFIFTFTFFGLAFTAVNKEHFDTLNQYDIFAVGRDAQLKEQSQFVEVHYANETARMEMELETRQLHCQEAYLNQTLLRFLTGMKNQVEYHNDQMNNPMGNLSLNFSAFKEIFVQGDGLTACNLVDGAIVWVNSKQTQIVYTPDITQTIVNYSSPTNATYTQIVPGNLTALVGDGYDTSFSNFSEVQNVLGPACELATWCYGWGFVNRDGSDPAFYVMLNEMGDPVVEEGVSGICFGAVNFEAELSFLAFNSSYFEDYADKLNQQYLQDFQSYADDMYDTLSGLWSAMNDFPTNFNFSADGKTQIFNYDKNINNEAGAGYSFSPAYKDFRPGGSDANGTLKADWFWDLDIACEDCPKGNFTQAALQYATSFLFNGSNMSDYTNLSDLPVNFSNLISINTAWVEFPDLPTIELPFDFDFPIDLSLITSLCLSLDALLFIYRWYRTTGIVARIVRGKDVDVGLSYLMVNQSKPRCCYGRSIMDYCLNAVIYCHDFLFRLGYNAWMIFYWVWFLLRIAIVALLVWMLYVLVDQMLTVEFIEGIGTFQLMTVGLGAQRSVRNQVLCSTALGYNNYTLTNLEQAIGDYAKERNDDAWAHNLAELARVDSFNALFCQGWVAYQTAPRAVTSESPNKAWVDLNSTAPADVTATQVVGTYYTYHTSAGAVEPLYETDIEDLFDDDASTYWTPYPNGTADSGTDVILDFYLSKIYMNNEGDFTWWNILQISFNWRFIEDPSVTDGATAVSFAIYVDVNNSGVLQEIAYPNGNEYKPEVAGNANTRQTAESAIKIVTISQEINTPRIRVVLQNVSNWGTEYSLNDLSFAGHAPKSKVLCPEVKFRFWEFDASPTNNENASAYVMDTPTAQNPDGTTYYDGDGTYVAMCPQITPIHGMMYRGFVRTWLNEQLIIGHEPFILALRNIALSPFFLAIILIGILFIAYLFAFIMEWFLMKLDLFRENPYAKVPLVTTSYDKYDTDLHETAGDHGTIYGTASVGKDYYRPTTSKEEEESTGNLLGNKHVDRNEIEMGLSSQVTVRDKNKKKVPGEAAGDTYKAPEEEEYAEYDC